MDNELFELCKEVYKRTKWADHELNKGAEFAFNTSINTDKIMVEIPLYTSDYLLEKLPKVLCGYNLTLDYMETIPETEQVRWDAGYATHFHDGTWEVKWDSMASGDTPLKALLKLVIDLDDAGVKL